MPDSGVPHRGGTPVPPLHLRMNKNGFQVTHLTETQKKKKTQSISLTQSSQGPALALCSPLSRDQRRKSGRPGPKSPRTSTLPISTLLWVETLLGA